MAYIPGMKVDAPTARPGWYRPTRGPVRWWDGRRWTGGFLREDGTPTIDAVTGHLPESRLLLGAALLGAMVIIDLALLVWSVSIGALTAQLVLLVLVFSAIAAFWAVAAHRAYRREREPAPLSQPLLLAQLRPLPGDMEGPGAGWYPAPDPTHLRWWTGRQWAHYVYTRGRFLPTYGLDALARRNVRYMHWAVIAGLVVTALGLLVLVLGLTGTPALLDLAFWLSVTGFATSVAFLIARPLARRQARQLGLPAHPPTGAPMQPAVPAPKR